VQAAQEAAAVSRSSDPALVDPAAELMEWFEEGIEEAEAEQRSELAAWLRVGMDLARMAFHAQADAELEPK
jgi:dsDNA-binding SOS-regulon protein